MKIYTVQDIERFWKYVRVGKPNECWEWLGGHGGKAMVATFSFNGESSNAARFSFWIHTGVWPGNLEVCHSCDNAMCVNPNHLWLGTHLENMHDALRKGRLGKNRGERHGNAKLTEAGVKEIREKYAAGGITTVRLAKEYGVCQATIAHVVNRIAWKHIG